MLIAPKIFNRLRPVFESTVFVPKMTTCSGQKPVSHVWPILDGFDACMSAACEGRARPSQVAPNVFGLVVVPLARERAHATTHGPCGPLPRAVRARVCGATAHSPVSRWSATGNTLTQSILE